MALLKIAFRNVFRHRRRSAMTLATVVFGCSALVFCGGFFEDNYRKVAENGIHAHTGHLQIFRKGYGENGNARPFDYLILDPASVIAMLKERPETENVLPRLAFFGLLGSDDRTVSCFGTGVDPSVDKLEKPRKRNALTAGAVLTNGTDLDEKDPSNVALAEGLAEAIGANVGDNLVLFVKTADDSTNGQDVKVAGIYTTGLQDLDKFGLRLPLTSTQQLLRTDGVQSLTVFLHKTADTAAVKHWLNRTIQEKNLDLEVKSWDEINDFYVKTKLLYGHWFSIINFIIALIVILGINNTMNMAVSERTVEIGTLMAMGSRGDNVVRLFMLEGLMIGIVGGVIGIVAGAVLTSIIGKAGLPMPPGPGFTTSWTCEPFIVPSVLVSSFLLAVVSAIVSSVSPAFRASRLDIADALRRVG